MSITKTPTGFMIEPDIDFTDNLFEFPCAISMLKKQDKGDSQLRKLGLVDDDDDDDEEDEDPIIGIIAFPHEMIVGYADWMRSGRDKEDVERYGFDLTEVYIRGEFQSYFCTWKREVFKKKLNEHVKNLMKKRSESVYQQYDLIKPVLNDAPAKSDDTNTPGLG